VKLIYCVKCGTLTSLVLEKVRYCKCRKCAGKYLKDGVTSVTNEFPILVGIDNNTLHVAAYRYAEFLKHKDRVDFFFTGWIPNKPGESIEVPTTKDVKEYPYEEEHNWTSTMPVSKDIKELKENGTETSDKESKVRQKVCS